MLEPYGWTTTPRRVRRSLHAIAASAERAAALAVIVLAGCAATASPTASPTTLPPPPPEELRATLFYSDAEVAPGRPFPLPLVRGSIAGHPTVLVVDTGAEVSVVGSEIARAAGLEVGVGVEGEDISGGAVSMQRVDRPRFALAGVGPLPERSAAVVELPPLFGQLGIGGILSPQAFADERRAVVLDFPRDEMRFVPAPSAGRMLPLTLGEVRSCRYEESGFQAHALVAAATVGEVATTFQLDTGASGTFVVADSEIGRLVSAHPNTETARAMGAGGPIETTRVDDVRVEVGAVDASGSVRVTPGERDRNCGYDGRIGIDRLRSCVLVIDASRTRGSCERE